MLYSHAQKLREIRLDCAIQRYERELLPILLSFEWYIVNFRNKIRKMLLHSCKRKGKIDKRIFPNENKKTDFWQLNAVNVCVFVGSCKVFVPSQRCHLSNDWFDRIWVNNNTLHIVVLHTCIRRIRLRVHFQLFFIFFFWIDFSLQFFDNEKDTQTRIHKYSIWRRFCEESVMSSFIFTNDLHNEIWWRQYRQWRMRQLTDVN